MIITWKRIARGNLRIWQYSNRGKFRELFLFTLLMVILYAHHDIMLQREIERRHLAEVTLRDMGAFKELPTVTFIVEAKSPENLYQKLSGLAGDIDKQRADLFNYLSPNKKGK